MTPAAVVLDSMLIDGRWVAAGGRPVIEVIDPATEEPLDYGEKGELVITTLTKEALPVFRYRTRDLTALDPSRCECGRTLVRMSKVRQRTDDMLIIRGVNVFPTQIEDVLFRIEGVRPHYLIVVDRKKNLDDLEVRLEVGENVFSDVMSDMVAFQGSVADKLQSVLGLRARVTLVEPGAIERTAGKAKRVLDLRERGERSQRPSSRGPSSPTEPSSS